MIKNKILFYILSFTWGLPMTLIGGVIALMLLCAGYRPKKWGGCWYFTVGKNWGGVELGLLFLTDSNENEHTKNHEFGHAIQNCFFGPLMPFLVCIPSATRYWYREFKYNRKGIRPPTNYDDIWFEGQATKLGTKCIEKW